MRPTLILLVSANKDGDQPCFYLATEKAFDNMEAYVADCLSGIDRFGWLASRRKGVVRFLNYASLQSYLKRNPANIKSTMFVQEY